tara:strand:- start:692 stop:967 length:276 start_codon:yes stop_codon:yes gene_type:complete
MKILLSIITIGLLCACSRGHDGGDFVFIGCHIVHTNPANCLPGTDRCVYAFGPEGDKMVGEKIWWKQLRKGQDRYGPIGKIATARPCKEGE